MTFPPVAVVGWSCLLPGAQDPPALWRAVLAGQDLLGHAPAGRWRIDPARVLSAFTGSERDSAWSDRGGYVLGFESAFDPNGFALPAEELLGLDPLFLWTLHTARAALRDASHEAVGGARIGLVLGNLSFPSAALSRLAEGTWLGERALRQPVDPRNRFQSGLPAHLAAQALGLGGGAHALDAACASSFYALKLACDRLHDGTADMMLAGAVNAADDLFIHAGFTALKALSPSGRSRPFHREADGLVPAEGAAFVALKRLPDAVAAGDRILGVIRGIGLSNDGRGSGLLAPAEEGQRRALLAAYAMSGLRPRDVSLLECHATGTAVGDATEIRSSATVFEGCRDVPIGSVKSNLGHLITVAGMAGLIKVLGALASGVRPQTLHAFDPLPALAASPFRLLRAAEPWDASAPRRAGLSAFGFGGNNAHVIVEEWCGELPDRVSVRVAGPPRGEVAVVALGLIAADTASADEFAAALFAGTTRVRPGPGGHRAGFTESVALDAASMRFPPRDLEQALPQQLLILRAAQEAVSRLSFLPLSRTAVVVGMQCDAEIARYGARWRLAEWAALALRAELGSPAALAQARDAFARPLTAAGVVGSMPNVCANRLNSQFDARAASLTVASEELSGVVALQLAARALRAREVDAALVGAVDVCSSEVHARAARAVLEAGLHTPGDAAVVLVLKRLADARRDGDQVIAILADEDAAVPPAEAEAPQPAEPTAAREVRGGTAHPADAERPPSAAGATSPIASDSGATTTALFGHAHAASGLLAVAAAALALRHRADPGGPGKPAEPRLHPPVRDSMDLRLTALGGATGRVRLEAGDPAPLLLTPTPRVHLFAAGSRGELREALRARAESREGELRLALVAASEDELAHKAARAEAILEGDRPPLADEDGIALAESPIGGELAFVFTAPAGAYRGMGRELALAAPALLDSLHGRWAGLRGCAGWVYDGGGGEAAPEQKLWGSSYLCQLHAELTRGVLKLAPSAAIGLCSGETNALYALGAWHDIDGIVSEIAAAAVYTRELAGEFAAVRRFHGLAAGAPVRWASHRVLAPLDRLRAAIADEPLARLAIVNAPDDAVLSGDAAACERVLVRIGKERSRPLGYDMAVHCPELQAFAGEWRRIHCRDTRAVPGVRFYTHASCDHYALDSEAVADALLGQALSTVDFPRLVEKAWSDGVRVFLEHGPQGGCSRWISKILGDRPHLAVPLDLSGVPSLRQAANAVARLAAAGVALDLDAFHAAFAHQRPSPAVFRPLRFAVAREAPRLPEAAPRPMAPAPALPPAAPQPPIPTPAPHDSQPLVATPAASHALLAAPAPPAPATARSLRASAAPRRAASARMPQPSSSAAALAADGPLLDRIVSEQRRVSAVHREYLEGQAAIHRRFLALRSSLLSGTAVLEGEVKAAPPMPVSPARQLPTAIPVAPTPVLPATPAAPMPASPVPRAQLVATTPRRAFSRTDLETHACGRISSLFGPLFEPQDGYLRQVRMPEPPLLLADRVTAVEGEPGSMGLGTVWTETDVREDAFYLHAGRMPAGILIESGQADLFLISWLGVDLLNRGERVYRLLGCELTYHAELPAPGETLRYDIHVDGHARQGDVRLFFFHYDCRTANELRLSVRHGQAGFFTDEELRASGGVLWDAAEHEPAPARVDPPAVEGAASCYSAEAVRAFSEGRVAECFGASHALAETHVETPRIASGKMLLIGEVAQLDPHGGPWRRGYLRSVRRLAPDDWFYAGHFKNDPCMPGTLMFEGCLQAMAFYLAALGYTLDRDGWRFEPVSGVAYRLRCRGQATPASRELVYEVFVSELRGSPEPELFADLLCTVDGVKAFHCARMGLRLRPDTPMARRPERREGPQPSPRALTAAGVTLDFPALLACAWGKPSHALGPPFEAFDGARRMPRLPGPPYHFLSRVTRLSGAIGELGPGAEVEVEYDVPHEAWYFGENGAPTMPFCVLLEAALQPCGWLALGTGIPLEASHGLHFRNLDGTGRLLREIGPGAGSLRTQVRLADLSRTAGMSLVSFEVSTHSGEDAVFEMKTGFGFFPSEALANQVGLPATEEDRTWLLRPSERRVELAALRAGAAAALPGARLFMLDRITGFWPGAGRAGLSRWRAEKDVRAGEWFFKAHFYQDPVQPGSLGLQALLQLVQCAMIERGLERGLRHPAFEPIALRRPLVWKYRGQVVPANRVVTLEVELVEIGEDESGRHAVADGWLSVDGKRIYAASGLAMRVKDSGSREANGQPVESTSKRNGKRS